MPDKATLIVSRNALYFPTPTGLKIVASLDELFSLIKTKKITVLVAPNLSYLEKIGFPSSKTITEQDLIVELNKLIPESVNETLWATELVEKKDESREYLAFVLEQSFFKELIDLLKQQNVVIDRYGSLAQAVADLSGDPESHLTIYIQNNLYFLVAKINHQYLVHNFDNLANIKNEILNFLVELETTGQTKITKLYSFTDLDLSSLELIINELPINYSALKPSCLIDPRAVSKLGFRAGETEIQANTSSKQASSTASGINKLLIVLIISMSAMSFVIWWKLKSTVSPVSAPSSSPVPVEVVTSPEPIRIRPPDQANLLEASTGATASNGANIY